MDIWKGVVVEDREGLQLHMSKEETYMLAGKKKAIIIGERDGVASPAIEECLKTIDVEPIYSLTQCYV